MQAVFGPPVFFMITIFYMAFFSCLIGALLHDI